MTKFDLTDASMSQIQRLLRSLTYEEVLLLSQSSSATSDLEGILNETIVLAPTDVTEKCRYCEGNGYYYKTTKAVSGSADNQKGSE